MSIHYISILGSTSRLRPMTSKPNKSNRSNFSSHASRLDKSNRSAQQSQSHAPSSQETEHNSAKEYKYHPNSEERARKEHIKGPGKHIP